ncbi:MAG: hypothetical protein K0R49_1682 [Burkholderiales bacterium]|jgi:hypothetical protein|nr:hypothetical protein [Burkholderiales bacterium]
MIKYFCDFIDNSKLADELLKTYYANYAYKLGLTEDKIEKLMNEMKEQEIKRTQNN